MKQAHEFKVMRIRECAFEPPIVDTPQRAFDYWMANITKSDWFDPCKEAFVVLVLNTRRRIIGHNLISLGTLDSCQVHPREVFRPVIVAAGSAIILMHNHPSLDSSPSEADTKVTRDLIRAGQLLRIQIVDHVIVGERYHSLKELGFLYEGRQPCMNNTSPEW
jgi:DNA repair protein RadC